MPQDIPQLVETVAEFIGKLATFGSIKSQVMRDRSVESVTDSAVEIASRMGVSQPTMSQTLASMSGGERQRAVLAVSFALKPCVLLLDEPTSALDAGSTKLVELELLKLAKDSKVCVIFTSHDPQQRNRLSNFRIKFTTTNV